MPKRQSRRQRGLKPELADVYIDFVVCYSLLMGSGSYESPSNMKRKKLEYKDSVYPNGYQVGTIVYAHSSADHCFTIEKYIGSHSDEYLECYRIDNQKTGIGTLYKQGERILQCFFHCNTIQGWGTLYQHGIPIVQVLWKDNDVIQTVMLKNISSSKLIDEKSSDGSLVYTGGYDLCTYHRDGYGVVYTNNEKVLYGQFENNELIHICKTFTHHQMTEYDKYNTKTYVGEYDDSLECSFPRKGQGTEYRKQSIVYEGGFDQNKRNGYGISYHENGVLSFKGKWKDNEEIEGYHLALENVQKDVSESGRFTLTPDFFPVMEMYSSVITTIQIDNHTCNQQGFSELVISSYPFLKEIVIGDGCCKFVRFFVITNLNCLESIRIGRDSFTLCNHTDNAPNRNNNEDRVYRENRSFSVINCPQLQQCIIDVGSFSDYLIFTMECGDLF